MTSLRNVEPVENKHDLDVDIEDGPKWTKEKFNEIICLCTFMVHMIQLHQVHNT